MAGTIEETNHTTNSALATDVIEFDDGSMVWTTDGQIGVSRPAWGVIESGEWIDLRNWPKLPSL